MAQLFKEKNSKFGSLISVIAVTAMLALFSLALPEFLTSTTGRIFAAAWAVMAIVIFVAHTQRMSTPRRRYAAQFALARQEVRAKKKEQRLVRFLRGH